MPELDSLLVRYRILEIAPDLQDPGRDRIVDAELALIGEDAEVQGGHRLRNRIELVVIVAVEAIAVPLEDELGVLHDEQTADVEIVLTDPLRHADEGGGVDIDLFGEGEDRKSVV